MGWLKSLYKRFAESSGELKVFVIAVIVMFVVLMVTMFYPIVRLPQVRTTTQVK